MHANHPEIAKKWETEYGDKIVPKRADGKSDMRRVKGAANKTI